MLFWLLTRILSHPYRQTGHFLTLRSFNTWLKIGWTLHRRFAKCYSKMTRSTILDLYWTMNTSALAVTTTWLIIWPDTSPVIISGIYSYVNLVCPLMFIFCYELFISRPQAYIKAFSNWPLQLILLLLISPNATKNGRSVDRLMWASLMSCCCFKLKLYMPFNAFHLPKITGQYFTVQKYPLIKQNTFFQKCY